MVTLATLEFETGGVTIPVPLVVSGDPVSQPITGFNVIKHLIFEGGEESDQLLPHHPRKKLSEPVESVTCTPNILDSELELEEIVTKVKLGRTYSHVVVTNPTNSTLILDKGIVLGSIEAISAVVPISPNEELKENGIEATESV